MRHFEFTLRFSVPSSTPVTDVLLDKLYESGCDDALIGIGQPGRIAFQFDREAGTAAEAMLSAIDNVKHAIPDALLIEATPDFVGLSDIAQLFGFTRQNMRKLMLTNRSSFPWPVHEGKAAIWHLADVLGWFQSHQNKTVSPEMIEVASTTMRLNIARQLGQLDPSMAEKLLY